MNSQNIAYFIDEPVLAFGLIAFFLLLVALPLTLWSLGDTKTSNTARILIILANFSLASQLTLRWWQSGHFPISNLYESLCFLTWSFTFAQILLEKTFSSPLVLASTTPIALLCIAFASFALPERLQESSPLVPALRSSWLVMHVSVVMCSYAALIVGSLLSIAVLFTDRDKKFAIRSSSTGSGGFRDDLALPINNSFNMSSVEFSRIEKLDSISYRSITFGFLLLTLGLISGAVWANEAWGTWWSWDPKETWALICWLVYAAYLHTRITRGWTGRKPAIVSSIGLVVIVVCYIGVNLLGVGLHSYGWFF